MAGTFYAPGAAGVPLYQAVQYYDKREQGLSATQAEEGVAPPGWERSIKRMKKHNDIDNPWALAWWMRRNGAKPATHDEEADAEFDAAMAHATLMNKGHMLPKEYKAAARGEVWAQSLLLDPNLPLLVVERR